jgi:hypothetical protein
LPELSGPVKIAEAAPFLLSRACTIHGIRSAKLLLQGIRRRLVGPRLSAREKMIQSADVHRGKGGLPLPARGSEDRNYRVQGHRQKTTGWFIVNIRVRWILGFRVWWLGTKKPPYKRHADLRR